MESREFVLYPARLSPLLRVLISAVVAVPCIVWFLNRISDFKPVFAILIGIFVVLASTLWLSWVIYVLQEILGPRSPLFRLDTNGIECALGLIWWTDVERAEIVGYERETEHGGTVTEEWLSLKLRPGARPIGLPVSGYAADLVSDSVPRLVDGNLEVRATRKKQDLLDAVRRFYPGPQSEKIHTNAGETSSG